MKIKKLLAVALLCFGLTACDFGGSVKAAEKDSVDQGAYSVNPKSVVGYVGDVMPFYDNGRK